MQSVCQFLTPEAEKPSRHGSKAIDVPPRANRRRCKQRQSRQWHAFKCPMSCVSTAQQLAPPIRRTRRECRAQIHVHPQAKLHTADSADSQIGSLQIGRTAQMWCFYAVFWCSNAQR